MCGIVGLVGEQWTSDQFDRLFERIAHRGPDQQGSIELHEFRIGMNRLQIRGAEVPLPVRTQKTTTSFNGQIYGIFDSNGEVWGIPPGLEHEVNLLNSEDSSKLDGMFAAAVTNHCDTTLSLSTDRHFIKPLFFALSEKGIAFCSEFVPLARLNQTNTIHVGALSELFSYNWYLRDQTFLDNHFLVNKSDILFKEGVVHADPVEFEFYNHSSQVSNGVIRDKIGVSVQRCLEGRGPFALAVSGGLDSTILAWEINRAGFEGLITISVVLPDNGDGIRSLEELSLPRGGAWETWTHFPIVIDENWNFAEAFEAATLNFGHPTNMSSLPLFQIVADVAGAAGARVLISGEGIDEYWGGYASYAKVGSLQQISDYYHNPARISLIRILFEEHIVDEARANFEGLYQHCTDIREIERDLRLTRLLLRTDVCSMSRSIEGRVPFLHNTLPDIALSIPWSQHLVESTKSVLRSAYQDVPFNISTRHKTRFKISDEVLRGLIREGEFRERIEANCGNFFEARRVRDCLNLLQSEGGFDSDIFCLLASFSFLIECGIARA